MAKKLIEEESTKEAPKVVKQDDKYFVGQVATATERVIVDRETEEQYTLESAMVLLLNRMEELIDKVVG